MGAVCYCGHALAHHDAVRRLCLACGCTSFMEGAHDPVNAPAHYTRFPGGVEPIAIAEHLTYNKGAALKYIARAGHKGDEIEDLRKARWHIEREIARLTATK